MTRVPNVLRASYKPNLCSVTMLPLCQGGLTSRDPDLPLCTDRTDRTECTDRTVRTECTDRTVRTECTDRTVRTECTDRTVRVVCGVGGPSPPPPAGRRWQPAEGRLPASSEDPCCRPGSSGRGFFRIPGGARGIR